jgi:2-polyprenyl-6-methoxyphenol hydroxylase-like FAD-dependent oxidoreductase
LNEVFQTDVLIVGAGPTGLMAANQLKRFNIDFIIIDMKAGPTLESRAIAVTSKSLEIYQQMGLIDEVMKEGARINSFNIYTGGKRRAKVTIKKSVKEFLNTLFCSLMNNSKMKNYCIKTCKRKARK